MVFKTDHLFSCLDGCKLAIDRILLFHKKKNEKEENKPNLISFIEYLTWEINRLSFVGLFFIDSREEFRHKKQRHGIFRPRRC